MIHYYKITIDNQGQTPKEIREDFDQLISGTKNSLWFKQNELQTCSKEHALDITGGNLNKRLVHVIYTPLRIIVIGVSL